MLYLGCLVVALFRLNFRQQKFAVSLTYFERALDLMQKKYGKDGPQLISVYQSLGRVSLIMVIVLVVLLYTVGRKKMCNFIFDHS